MENKANYVQRANIVNLFQTSQGKWNSKDKGKPGKMELQFPHMNLISETLLPCDKMRITFLF